MKVLLVDPPNAALSGTGNPVHVHPLGLAQVAAAVAPDHDVWQLIPDVRPYADPEAVWRDLERTITGLQPDVVGITAVSATFPGARILARRCREWLGSDVTVVLGGVHASFMPHEALAEGAIDLVVTGEGDEAFPEVLRALGRGADPTAVAGVVGRREDGSLTPLRRRPPIADLDALPLPRRTGVLWNEHLLPSFYQSLITVRGCPYSCIYCSVPQSSQRRTRYRSAERVADEVAALRSDHDVPYLFFHDSVFTLNRRRTVDLMDRLIERDLVTPYACQTRTDRVDPALLARMRAGGCHQVFFGIESGHPETLRRIRKDVPLAGIREAVRQAKQLGIRCSGFFMVGFPWETEEHVRATAALATDLDLDAVSLFSATPLPGTALWDETRIALPEAIDFRAPQVNLTAMPPERYAALFHEVRADLEAYNRAQMESALPHWPRG